MVGTARKKAGGARTNRHNSRKVVTDNGVYDSQLEATFHSRHPLLSHHHKTFQVELPVEAYPLLQRLSQVPSQDQQALSQLRTVLTRKYTPDFYDPQTDSYYEVKGMPFGVDDIRLWKAFMEQHPHKLILALANPHRRFMATKKTNAERLDKEGIEWIPVEPAAKRSKRRANNAKKSAK